jgi:hypothetical protein
MKKIKLLFNKINKPTFTVLILSLFVLVISMYFAHKIRSYGSDDVSWQTIIRSWDAGSKNSDVILGSSNNFFDKLPFFLAAENLFPSGRKLLFLESVLMAVPGFVLYYFSSLYFLRRIKIELNYKTLLPFVWISGLGFAFAELYLNPIWRGFEMGLYFGLTALVAMYINREIDPFKTFFRKILTTLLAVVVGILIFSDPFILYFFIGPLLVWAFFLWTKAKITSRQIIILLVFFVISFLASKFTELLFEYMGFRMATEYPIQFVDFENFGSNIKIGVHALLSIFNASFFGRNPISITAITTLFNFSILSFLLYRVLLYKGQIKSTLLNLNRYKWMAFFVLLFAFTFLLYIFSTVSVGTVQTYRYLITCVLIAPMLLVYTSAHLRNRLILPFLIISILLNLFVSAFRLDSFLVEGSNDNRVAGQTTFKANKANALNYKLITALKKEGVAKAYANYWEAGINTYLSRGTVEVLPIDCEYNRTVPMKWLVDLKRYQVPADKTGILLDPHIKYPASCTYDQIISQFGPPAHELKEYDIIILVYDYDLYGKMN